MIAEGVEHKTAEEIGRHLQDVLAAEGKELDKKIHELAGKKNAEKWRRYTLSAAAGALGATPLAGLLLKAPRAQ